MVVAELGENACMVSRWQGFLFWLLSFVHNVSYLHEKNIYHSQFNKVVSCDRVLPETWKLHFLGVSIRYWEMLEKMPVKIIIKYIHK